MNAIKQADIQVGDIIKVTEIDQGVRVERSGAVGTIGNISGSLYSAEGGALWVDGWAGKYSFDLIDRPQPPLPTKIGTIVIANDTYGLPLPIILNEKDCWQYLDGVAYNLNYLKSWKLAKVVEA